MGPFDHLSDDQLLDALDEEWQKFDRSDPNVMRDMIGVLILRGVYPKEHFRIESDHPVHPRKMGTSAEAMVNGYGARWHIFRGPLECPRCGADLRSPEGPPFKREIGMYDQGLDRTTHFVCPDCKERLS